MRLAPLTALLAVGALVTPRADAQCAPGSDFTSVDISEINAIPQANLDQLNAAGADLELADTQALLTSAFDEQMVEFTGVIMSDPLLSGVRSLNGEGVPNSIQYWVRDSDAATTGPAGQNILINDEAGDGYARSLNRGQEVTVCGTVTSFTTGGGTGAKILQVSPLAGTAGATVVGIVPADDPLLAPVTITTDDIHDFYTTADGPKSQIDWNVYPDFVGQYVRFEGIELVQGIPDDERPNTLFSTPGQDTQINGGNNSVCFDNRRGPDYFPTGPIPECVTDGDFVPPSSGIVNLQGFLIFSGFDGPFNFAIPENANFTVLPWEESDFEITTAPPAVAVEGPTSIPGSSDAVTITITAVQGDAPISSVVVDYEYLATGTTGQATATLVSDDTYTATIPAGPNESFVSYSVTASDTQGATTTVGPESYYIFDGSITSLSQIQTTIDGEPGPSPFYNGDTVALNIDLTARVQSVIQSGTNYYLTLQDDASLAPFTGIWVFLGSAEPTVVPGDDIAITGADLTEFTVGTFAGSLTQLTDLAFTVVGSGDPYPYKVVPTAVLAAPAAAEQHEGMLVRFENVTITDTNADGDDGDNGFGEWEFTNGATADEVRADDLSENFPSTYNIENFPVGATVTYIQGPWTSSFGNFKVIPVELTDIGAISVSAEEEAAAAALSLTVAPNPLRNAATIRFETPATGAVSVRVYDVTGREVAVLLDRELAAGEASVELDASGLASGVYVVRLQAGATVAATQLSVVR